MMSVIAVIELVILLGFIVIGLSDWRPYAYLEIGERVWVIGSRAAYDEDVAERAAAMERHPAGKGLPFHVEQYRAYKGD